jgi:hypothetical protein
MTDWATDLYELEYEDPETLWQLILTTHSKSLHGFKRFFQRVRLRTY